MRKLISLLCFGFCCLGSVFAQGFPWILSSRLPFEHPQLYIGPSLSIGWEYHSANIQNLEGFLLCGVYTNGSATQYSTAVAAEYWSQAFRAINTAIRWTKQHISFTDQSDPIPQKDAEGNTLPPLITEYEYRVEMTTLSIAIQVKHRLLWRYFSLLGGISITTLLNYSAEQRERILQPAERPFADGSYERVIGSTPEVKIVNFNIGGIVGITMDFPLFYPVYISPTVALSLPFFPVESYSSWRSIAFIGSVGIFIGI